MATKSSNAVVLNERFYATAIDWNLPACRDDSNPPPSVDPSPLDKNEGDESTLFSVEEGNTARLKALARESLARNSTARHRDDLSRGGWGGWGG